MNRLTAAVLPLLMLLTSCTVSAYDALETASITTPFADSDPQDFGPKAPSDYPIHGIDVSKWQGDIDWQKARAHGVSFAFVKATEGGDRVDPRFDTYWRGARAAGIPVAPYHFYYFCTPPLEQANWFIRNVPRRAVVMPPVIDMEWNPNSPTCRLRPPPAVVRRDLEVFANRIAAYYGKKPIIYTTIDFHRKNFKGHFRGYDFWLRSVADHPDNIYDGRDWTFWQYTGTGIVPGIQGNADISVFDGDGDAWNTWLSAATK
jgi:lysozyme